MLRLLNVTVLDMAFVIQFLSDGPPRINEYTYVYFISSNQFLSLSFAISPLPLAQNCNYSIAFIGKVNLKSLPFPSSLSTQILPPCFSTNSLHSIMPSPVLGSPSVPFRVILPSRRNKCSTISRLIPMPVSLIDIPMLLSLVVLADRFILSYLCVNFTAFETRFLITD